MAEYLRGEQERLGSIQSMAEKCNLWIKENILRIYNLINKFSVYLMPVADHIFVNFISEIWNRLCRHNKGNKNGQSMKIIQPINLQCIIHYNHMKSHSSSHKCKIWM